MAPRLLANEFSKSRKVHEAFYRCFVFLGNLSGFCSIYCMYIWYHIKQYESILKGRKDGESTRGSYWKYSTNIASVAILLSHPRRSRI